jgi:hypothetical protein
MRGEAMRRVSVRVFVLLGMAMFMLAATAFAAPQSVTDYAPIDGFFTVYDPNFPSTPTVCPDGRWEDIVGPHRFTGTLSTSTFPLFNGKRIVVVLSYTGGGGGAGIAYGRIQILDQSVLLAKGPFSAATNGHALFGNSIWLGRLHLYSGGSQTAAQAVVGGQMHMNWDVTNGGSITANIGGGSAGGSLYWDGTRCAS